MWSPIIGAHLLVDILFRLISKKTSKVSDYWPFLRRFHRWIPLAKDQLYPIANVMWNFIGFGLNNFSNLNNVLVGMVGNNSFVSYLNLWRWPPSKYTYVCVHIYVGVSVWVWVWVCRCVRCVGAIFKYLYMKQNYLQIHDDVIKWKHFPRYRPFVWGIHRSPVNSSHKGQWRGALMFSLICAWINGWVNNREAGDLRRYCAHYNVTIMNT